MQFHQTRIYRRSLELAALCREVIDALPPGYAFLADQLRRSSSSVVLNFCEGYGKRSRKDARRYFDIARGSANEVAGTLDWGHTFRVVNTTHHARGLELSDHVVRMLTRFRR